MLETKNNREKKYHYFLFDFCYYANLLILAYVNFFPKSETLFAICFAFCTGIPVVRATLGLFEPQANVFLIGPLAWSILAWRNSLVFHSLDKTTSLFIHLTPNLLFYALRWLDKHPERYIDYDSLKNVLSILTQTMRSVARYETFRDNNDISFSTMILTPIVPYLLWQAFYFIKVQGNHGTILESLSRILLTCLSCPSYICKESGRTRLSDHFPLVQQYGQRLHRKANQEGQS